MYGESAVRLGRNINVKGKPNHNRSFNTNPNATPNANPNS